jgi:hypothetical protein
LGSSIATTLNVAQYVILTNRRLVFLKQTFLGGPSNMVHGEVPVAQLSLAGSTSNVVRIAFGADGDGVELRFGLIFEREARELVAALESMAA